MGVRQSAWLIVVTAAFVVSIYLMGYTYIEFFR